MREPVFDLDEESDRWSYIRMWCPACGALVSTHRGTGWRQYELDRWSAELEPAHRALYAAHRCAGPDQGVLGGGGTGSA